MTGVSARDRLVRGAILAAGVGIGTAVALAHLRVVPNLLLLGSIAVQWAGFWRRRRPAFVVAGGAFVSPFPPLLFVAMAGMLSACIAMMGDTRGVAFLGAVSGTLTSVVALLALLLCWRLPAVVLTPDGLVRRRFLRATRMTRWEDLTGPVWIRENSQSSLTLGVNGVAETMWPGRFQTDPRYLADAVEHYRTHPAERAAIGTPAEQDRLNRALREWAEAYWRAYWQARAAV